MLFVQITQSFFSHGAVMRRARQETKALLNAGHQVIVITDIRWKSELFFFRGLKKKPEIIIIKPFYFYKPFQSVSSELSFTLKVYFALRKLSKKQKIDFIVIHQSTASYSVARFAKKRKIPNAWVINDLINIRLATGNPYNWATTLMYKHNHSYGLKNMHYLIPVSKLVKKVVIRESGKPENTFIKYNTVDTDIFYPIEGTKKNIDVLYVGRLSVEKGVDILIDSSRYISKNRLILIIGDGPLIHQLKIQASKSKQNIKFLGFVLHEKIPYYIRHAKILVAPSLSELHAAVPLEAMACGVPVIASNVAGMADTIANNKNGWILRQNNSKELGMLIEKVLSDEEKLKIISQAAVKRADFFSEKKFIQDIPDFYGMLIKKYIPR